MTERAHAPVRLLDDRIRDRERWLARRREGIGGSDAAAAIGLNHWRSPLALWLDKKGLAAAGEDRRTAWGHRLEAMIAEGLAEHLGEGFTVTPCLALYRHPVIPWMLASPDGFVVAPGVAGARGDGGVAECKAVGPRMWHHWDDGLPIDVELQVRHNMAVLDLSYGWVAALMGGTTLQVYEVERDSAIEDRLIELETAFWELVVTGVPPAETGDEDEHRAVMETLRAEDGIEVPATEVRVLLAERAAYKDAEKTAGAAVRAAEERLALLLQGHRQGLVDGRTVVERRQVSVREHVKPATTYDRWVVPKDEGRTT